MTPVGYARSFPVLQLLLQHQRAPPPRATPLHPPCDLQTQRAMQHQINELAEGLKSSHVSIAGLLAQVDSLQEELQETRKEQVKPSLDNPQS